MAREAVNPKCPTCRHCVGTHQNGAEYYCVKCQQWFRASEVKP